MSPNTQAGGTASTGVEVRVLTDDGKCPLARVSFAPGEVVGPITVGRTGEWSIDAPGVAPMALELHFDGESLHVCAVSPGVRLAGRPLGRDWMRVGLPGDIRFGTARMVVLRGTDPGGKRASAMKQGLRDGATPEHHAAASCASPNAGQRPPRAAHMADDATIGDDILRSFAAAAPAAPVVYDDSDETTANEPATTKAARQGLPMIHDADDVLSEADFEEDRTKVAERPDYPEGYLPAETYVRDDGEERTKIVQRAIPVEAFGPETKREGIRAVAVQAPQPMHTQFAAPKPVHAPVHQAAARSVTPMTPPVAAAPVHAAPMPAVIVAAPLASAAPVASFDDRTNVGARPVLVNAKSPDERTNVGPRPQLPGGFSIPVAPAPMKVEARAESASPIAVSRTIPAPAMTPDLPPASGAAAPSSANDSRQAPTVVTKNRKVRARVLTLAFRGALALASVVLVVDLASGSLSGQAAAPTSSLPATHAAASASAAAPARPAASGATAARTAKPAAPAATQSAVMQAATTIANTIAAAPAASPASPIAANPSAPATSSAMGARTGRGRAIAGSTASNNAPNAKDGKDAKDATPVSTATSARGEKSLEQRAVDAAAAGSFRDAAILYTELARVDPAEPAYSAAARILADRAASTARNTPF